MDVQQTERELRETTKKYEKNNSLAQGIVTFVSPVVCLFVLYPMWFFLTDGSALLAMGLAIALAFILVIIVNGQINSHYISLIAQKESAVHKEIDDYLAEVARRAAAEEQIRKKEIERQQQAQAEEEARQKEKEQARMREWEKNFREKIQREELAADKLMSQSELVHEIARCILPAFKQIVEKVDTEAHMKVRVRLALEVRADTIDYYDAADPQNRSRFVFKEEGIAEKLSPILRKALCKALVTELRLLILEAFPIDPERKMVQADLEGSVALKSNVTYVPGRDYTAPEYDANSHAYAVILYQASKDKGERHF